MEEADIAVVTFVGLMFANAAAVWVAFIAAFAVKDNPLIVTRSPAANAEKVKAEDSVTLLVPVVRVLATTAVPTEIFVTLPLLSSVPDAVTMSLLAPDTTPVVNPSVNFPE
jgi:hypothetical protein